MILKPLSSLTSYSPVTPGCKHPPKRPFPRGLDGAEETVPPVVTTPLKVIYIVVASPLPHKGQSLSLEIRNSSRKMERAWEKGMSTLHGAQWHQESLNIPAPTQDGFYAFLQRGRLAMYINSARSVFIAMQRLGGAVLYASVCMALASYRLKLIPRDRPLTGRAKNFLGRALV